MNDTKSYIVAMLFAWIPYTAVAWGYKVLTDGTSKDFWHALGALLVARLFFSIIETLGSVLLWRVYGKRTTVQKTIEMLRANKLPKRQSAHEDFTNYLDRVENEPGYSAAVKLAAHDFAIALYAFERSGILVGMRMHSAFEAAFDLYSSKSEASTFTEVMKNASAENERSGVFDEMFNQVKTPGP